MNKKNNLTCFNIITNKLLTDQMGSRIGELPNTHISKNYENYEDYAQIICALCNKFRPPLSSGTFEKDIEVAA